MSRWIVLAIPVDGVSEVKRDAQIVTELDGSTEEAETALLAAARAYEHNVGKVRRREIYQCSNRSYFIRIHGRMATYGLMLQLAELIDDSAQPIT
ncbi:hypothetical protein AB0M92_23995 [Streptomyces sp. NPDC051582]|uniref:hypothetical protein n=1 Tax=Streptomyces sp. NPDC051582 TaxID=3155167 RepID=UPI00344784FC